MSRRRIIEFEGHIRNWALKYLRSQRWRYAGTYDDEDLLQEALRVFWWAKRKHSNVKSYDDFFKLFKVSLFFRIRSMAKESYPNTYNYSQDLSTGPAISMTDAETGGIIESLTGVTRSFASDVEDYIDLLNQMPDELKDVCTALMREVLGLSTIPSQLRRRLPKKRRQAYRLNQQTLEPLDSTLKRLFQLDDNIDPLLELALKVQPPKRRRRKINKPKNSVRVLKGSTILETYTIHMEPIPAMKRVEQHLKGIGQNGVYEGKYTLACREISRNIIVRRKTA